MKQIPEKYKNRTFEYEFQLQSAAVMMISQEFPRLRFKVWHTKNESSMRKDSQETKEQYEKRIMIEGNRNKAQGMLAGVPDILILLNGILFKIELKIPGGNPSPAQIELHHVWNKDCPLIPVEVFFTLEEVFDFCCKILIMDLKIFSLI